MNFDYRLGLMILLVAGICFAIPKSTKILAGSPMCEFVDNSASIPIYYSKNFDIEAQ